MTPQQWASYWLGGVSSGALAMSILYPIILAAAGVRVFSYIIGLCKPPN